MTNDNFHPFFSYETIQIGKTITNQCFGGNVLYSVFINTTRIVLFSHSQVMYQPLDIVVLDFVLSYHHEWVHTSCCSLRPATESCKRMHMSIFIYSFYFFLSWTVTLSLSNHRNEHYTFIILCVLILGVKYVLQRIFTKMMYKTEIPIIPFTSLTQVWGKYLLSDICSYIIWCGNTSSLKV